MTTDLQRLVEVFHWENWDWRKLSENPNITWYIVNKLKHKNWDWSELSRNPGIKWEDIKNNITEPWNFKLVLQNPNITWNNVIANMEILWDWNDMSFVAGNQKYITWDIIQKYMDKFEIIPIDFSRNPNLTWDIVFNNLNLEWDWYSLSYHPNITLDIIKNNLNMPWDWDSMSDNPNLTADFILCNLDKPWNWQFLSQNEHIPDWDKLLNNKYVCSRLNSEFVSENPAITWEIIQNNLEYDWDWKRLSRHPNITWNHIYDNENINMYPWNWYYLSMNPNITWNIVQQYIKFPWNIKGLSQNSSITFNVVANNDYDWDYDLISSNNFKRTNYLNSEENIKNKRKEFFNKIKNELIEITHGPKRYVNWCLDINERQEIKKRWNC